MMAYLDKGIKEIIGEYPEIETILNDYDIGCGPCSVGVCQLKDIVQIHRLPREQEEQLLARIARVIDPDAAVEVPEAQKPVDSKTRRFSYSVPMQRLVDEHVLIKRLIAMIPAIVRQLDVGSRESRQRVLDGVDMIRSYADRFHHAKEEDILFTYFDAESDILKVMFEDHTRARGYVKAVLAALERNDQAAVSEGLLAYRELLSEHIRKEDEILYPWMDSELSEAQLAELLARFDAADREIDVSPQKYIDFIDTLEDKYNA